MSTADAHRAYQRLRNKAFSLALGRSFAGFGARSVVVPPLRLSGEQHIHVGSGVFLGAGTWLQVLGRPPDVALTIGDGVSCAGGAVLSAVESVVIEPAVLIARGVYIADHGHAFEDPTLPVLAQGVRDVRPVRVGAGAWLGQNAVVLPGVTIGPGAVVAAGAVVRDDVAAHTLVVGSPARPVRSWGAAPQVPDAF